MARHMLPAHVNPDAPVRAEASWILQRYPHIASTTLYMKNVVAPEGTAAQVAATDGKSLFLWPAFWTVFTEIEIRRAILLHEYYHAVLAHSFRARRLRLKLGERFDPKLFNIAADAIINSAIRAEIRAAGRSGLKLTDDFIYLEALRKEAAAIVKLTGANIDLAPLDELGSLSVERLYAILEELRSASSSPHCLSASGDGAQGAGGQDGEQNEAGGGPAVDPDADPDPDADAEASPPKGQNASDQDRQLADSFRRRLGEPCDLLEGETAQMSAEELNSEIRKAGERLKNGEKMAGKGTSRLTEALHGDIPEVKTPWETHFRFVSQRYLSRERIKNYRRPGRRVMTQEAMGARSIVVSPSRRRMPVPNVVVILDSSASVSADEYRSYLAEIKGMKRRTHAEIYAIVADTEIQAEYPLQDVDKIKSVGFKGRGGTDFRPGIARAEELGCDLIVYLTDLGGAFPDHQPKIPVIWVAKNHGSLRPPWGKLVEIE